jgi:hypothetical protein
MVELPGFRAFQFHNGLDRVRDAFRVSAASMAEMERQACEAYDRYIDSGEDDIEYDDDGCLLRSTRHELEWAAREASLAKEVVREAFITSAFHYWETSARGWTGNHKSHFPGLCESVKSLGYPVSSDIGLLNSLNNLLKHDNPERGREVFDKRPDLFRWSREPTGDSWRAALRITDEDVEYFYGVIKASGPPVGT